MASASGKGGNTSQTTYFFHDGSQLVAEAYKRATAVLKGNRTVLDELAEMLVERETVDAEDLQELLIRSDVRVAEYV